MVAPTQNRCRAGRRPGLSLLMLWMALLLVGAGEAQWTAAPVADSSAAPAGQPGSGTLLEPASTHVSAEDGMWVRSLESEGDLPLLPLIAKVCIGLGLVVALAWGSVWLLRRTTLGQGAVGAGSVVKVMDRTWLGPKKAIFLVDIAGRTLALGVTEEQISLLSSWEQGQIDVAPPPGAGSGAFAVQLRSLLRRGDAVGQEIGA